MGDHQEEEEEEEEEEYCREVLLLFLLVRPPAFLPSFPSFHSSSAVWNDEACVHAICGCLHTHTISEATVVLCWK